MKPTLSYLSQFRDLPIQIGLSVLYAFAYLLLLLILAIDAREEISLALEFVAAINTCLILAVASRKTWAYRLLRIGLSTALAVVAWINFLYSQTYMNAQGSFTTFLMFLIWLNIHLFLTIVFFTNPVRSWFNYEKPKNKATF